MKPDANLISGGSPPLPTISDGATSSAPSRRRQILRQMMKSKFALPGGAIVLLFIVLAVLAPWIAPHDPYANDLMAMLMPPSWDHPFGRDELGRDILSRVLVGARLSLVEGLFSVSLAMAIGVPIGMISGYVGGRTDTIIMRFIDVMLA